MPALLVLHRLAGFLRFFLSELGVILKRDVSRISIHLNGAIASIGSASSDTVSYASMYLQHHLENCRAWTSRFDASGTLGQFLWSRVEQSSGPSEVQQVGSGRSLRVIGDVSVIICYFF